MNHKHWTALLLTILLLWAGSALAETVWLDGGAEQVLLHVNGFEGSKVTGSYYTGTQAELLERGAMWSKVQIGAETGWVHTGAVSIEQLICRGPAGCFGASDGWFNLRMKPGKDERVVSTLMDTDAVILCGETANGWYYVTCGERQGYLAAEYVKSLAGTCDHSFAHASPEKGIDVRYPVFDDEKAVVNPLIEAAAGGLAERYAGSAAEVHIDSEVTLQTGRVVSVVFRGEASIGGLGAVPVVTAVNIDLAQLRAVEASELLRDDLLPEDAVCWLTPGGVMLRSPRGTDGGPSERLLPWKEIGSGAASDVIRLMQD